VSKKNSNVPVFLIYAGIIHAIGLALLMPMLITLPGPGSAILPEPAAIDVEIVPGAPPQAQIEADIAETSALPAGPDSGEQEPAAETDAETDAVANVSPEAEMGEGAAPDQQAEPEQAKPAAKEESKAKQATSPKAQPASVKKPAAYRKPARPAVRRTAKGHTKIAPFNGALSGLFSPGAPAKRR
jgi:hypothetical protein